MPRDASFCVTCACNSSRNFCRCWNENIFPSLLFGAESFGGVFLFVKSFFLMAIGQSLSGNFHMQISHPKIPTLDIFHPNISHPEIFHPSRFPTRKFPTLDTHLTLIFLSSFKKSPKNNV